ncbi:hypothetical protein IJ674_01420 [bacterium]|nr:hypothetical protein [bacterium]
MQVNSVSATNFCANFNSPKLKFNKDDFFIRLKGYGQSDKWAQEVSQIADDAVDMFRKNTDAETVLKFISKSARYANRNCEDLHKQKNTGILRTDRAGWQSKEAEIFTPYNVEKYSTYSERLYNTYLKPLEDPYQRRIRLTKPSNFYIGKLFHGAPENINIAFDYVFNICKQIIPKYVKNDIKPKDLETVNPQIAEMRWVLAHSTPWVRGSDGISNIFMRAIYKAVGVKTYPVKKGVSLDLEAYCTNLKDYKMLWNTYFEKAPEIAE